MVTQTSAAPTTSVFTISRRDQHIVYKLDETEVSQIRMHPGDRLQIKSQFDFNIQFKGVSAFTTLEPQIRDRIMDVQVPANAMAGRYPFTVALYDHGDVLIDDPEIIIDRTEY